MKKTPKRQRGVITKECKETGRQTVFLEKNRVWPVIGTYSLLESQLGEWE